MRLIDADKLTDGKGIFNDVIHVNFEMGGGYIMVEDLLNILDNQPTAYDVDKVVERLEVNSTFVQTDDEDIVDDEAIVMLDDAIEIVRSGGKNEVN